MIIGDLEYNLEDAEKEIDRLKNTLKKVKDEK